MLKNADGTHSKYKEGSPGGVSTSEFFTTDGNVWYYAGADGKTVTGALIINGQTPLLQRRWRSSWVCVVKDARWYAYSKYDAY
ncbi:MAG: hypothetical protein ACLS9T_00280 [Streptococcus salivarius]